ncbi:MAG: hypothetical protein LBR99_05560 [Treponema sp.]|jgi:hypothetical protein|nr:hypothetical protein [Treponema sp.]
MGRNLSAALPTRSPNPVMNAGGKLRQWYGRLCEYKKPGPVRTGLRRRVFAEPYQMLKKGKYHYGRDPVTHEGKVHNTGGFWSGKKMLKI